MISDQMDSSSNRNEHHLVCPRGFFPSIVNPLRPVFHDPKRLLKNLVSPGDTVLDLGCGSGYFSFTLAQMVSKSGHVICIDLERDLLLALQQKAEKLGLSGRIQIHKSTPQSIGLRVNADFALAFWMFHEVKHQSDFLAELWLMLKPGAQLLIVEPKSCVKPDEFERSIEFAYTAGFNMVSRPHVSFSSAVLLRK